MNVLHVAQILAHVTGLVNQHLLLKNEYLVAENRILRSHLPKRLRLSDEERSTPAEIGKRLGRKLLDQIALVAKPDTILAWYRRLVAKKFDGSKARTYPGRPSVAPDVVKLVVQMAERIPVGVTTGLLGRSRTWGINSLRFRCELRADKLLV